VKQALHYSIVSAAVAGLLVGGVLKLGPDALAEFGGPQILISGSADRALDGNGGHGGAAFASYNGEIPDYVLGSDWTQPPDYLIAADIDAYEYDLADAAAPAPEPEIENAVFVAPVKISVPAPPKPVSYPSLDGDILGSDALTEVVEAQEEPDNLPS
jgi:hypothetical protein